MNVFRGLCVWLCGLIFSTLFIWSVAALFLDSIIPMQWDEELSLHVRKPGSVVRQRSEGWAETSIGKHGLVHGASDHLEASKKLFFFWGDSMADALQVSDSRKAVRLYNTSASRDLPKGVAVAGGGLGVADYFFRMPAYAALSKAVTGNVILLSGMEDVLPGRHVECHSRFLSNPWRLEASECIPSNLALRWAPVLAAYRMDFLHSVYRSVRDYEFCLISGKVSSTKPRRLRLVRPSEELEKGWKYLLAMLSENSDGFLTFVYCPPTPYLSKGSVVMDDPNADLKQSFFKICDRQGVDVVDLTADFHSFYLQTGRFPRGFLNSPPGTGHLNADGQLLIAEALLDYFRERKR